MRPSLKALALREVVALFEFFDEAGCVGSQASSSWVSGLVMVGKSSAMIVANPPKSASDCSWEMFEDDQVEVASDRFGDLACENGLLWDPPRLVRSRRSEGR
jgi:hypothetical protein